MDMVIGVAIGDGRVMAATGTCRSHVATARRLAMRYGERHQAAMLASLGAIAALGDTPAACVVEDDGEPTILDGVCAFEASKATSFHLFDPAGGWNSWSKAPTPATLCVEMED